MDTFKVGGTYTHNWISDSKSWSTYVVTKRTKCFVWVDQVFHGKPDGEPTKRKVFIDYDGNEAIMPTGNYSMAPTLRASKAVEVEIETEEAKPLPALESFSESLKTGEQTFVSGMTSTNIVIGNDTIH